MKHCSEPPSVSETRSCAVWVHSCPRALIWFPDCGFQGKSLGCTAVTSEQNEQETLRESLRHQEKEALKHHATSCKAVRSRTSVNRSDAKAHSCNNRTVYSIGVTE
eukprot:5978271-Amphidinium_carterae.1